MGAGATEDDFTLTAPTELRQTGLLEYLVPRFSLKTGVRVTTGPDGVARLVTEPTGTPVFTDGVTLWHLQVADSAPGAQRFVDWLTSEIGERTIAAFAAEGQPEYRAPPPVAQVAQRPTMTGDRAAGETLALTLCGRCHVVSDKNRMHSVGSTPSFAVLRTFKDWDARFQSFYVLKPHASFTQIAGLTEPFDPAVPPPMVPIELSPDDLDAIIAYTAGIAPADLGAGIQSN